MPGIRTIDDLKARCWVDEDTGCWHWRGACGRGNLWLPEPRRRSTTLGVAACWLRTGKLPAKGEVWHVICPTPNCANPEHRQKGDRRSQMLAAKYRPAPDVIARIASTKRARSGLSCADVAAIRASDEPLAAVAKRYGVSVSHASRIRRGEQRRPMPARGSSVFNL
jgi:hypothetical protein